MFAPRFIVRCSLIVGQLHVDLIHEFDLGIGYVIFDFSHLFHEIVITRIGSNFAFYLYLHLYQTCELEFDPVSGCFDPLCMPCKYYLQIGWLLKNGLFAACSFLGSFGTELRTDVQRHLLHGSADHIFILALVSRANIEDVSFEVLAGPNF